MSKDLFSDIDLFSDEELLDNSLEKDQFEDFNEDNIKNEAKSKNNNQKVNNQQEPVKKDSKSENADIIEEDVIELEDAEDKDDKTPQKSEKKGSSSNSPFKTFSKALYEEGLLSSFDEKEFEEIAEEVGGEAEALIELTRRTIINEIEEYKKQAEEDFRAFIEARDAGLDLNEWYKLRENSKTFLNVDEDSLEEDENLQKKIVQEYLKEKGFSNDEIEETIEAYEDTAKLYSKSKTALKNLKQIYEKKEQELKEARIQKEKEAEKARLETINTIKDTVFNSEEIISGIKINKQTKEKIVNNIITPVKKLPNGETINAITAKRLEDPIKFAIIESFLLEMGVFDGKIDKIKQKAQTEALKNLKELLDPKNDTSFKKGKSGVNDIEIEDSWSI